MKSGATNTNWPGTLFLIGYGNTLRGDDGAGVRLAERLAVAWWDQGLPVKLRTVQQPTPELAIEIASAAVMAVVFVDAAVDLPPTAIQVHRLAIHETSSPSLGHHCNPDALLTYAKMLYGRVPPAWLVTVPGIDFGHSEYISPTVQRLLNNIQEIATRLSHEIETSIHARTSHRPKPDRKRH